LEKTSKIIRSNLPPNDTMPTKEEDKPACSPCFGEKHWLVLPFVLGFI